MNIIKRIFLFTGILLILANCNKGMHFEIYNIKQASQKSSSNSVYYSLPRTVIMCKVKTIKTTTFPGPYGIYAEQYLGIKNAPIEQFIEWYLDSIFVDPILESDPDNQYVINSIGTLPNSLFFNFTKEGLIYNPSSSINSMLFNNIMPKSSLLPYFTDVTTESYSTQKTDTIYKVVMRDSVFVRIPVFRSHSDIKTLSEKAKEAAELIFRIRQARLEMVLSEENKLPEGIGLSIALTEMNRLENEYLKLFIGRQEKESNIYTFYYTPDAITKDNQFELFRFSTKTGVSDRTEPSASPVFMVLTKEGKTMNLNNFVTRSKFPTKNHIFYRIPDIAEVKLNWKGYTLMTKSIPISQFGTILSCPVKALLIK